MKPLRVAVVLLAAVAAACGGSDATSPGGGGDTPAFNGSYTLTFEPADVCHLPSAAFTTTVVVSQREFSPGLYEVLATAPSGGDSIEIMLQVMDGNVTGNLFFTRHTLASGLRITAFTTVAGRLGGGSRSSATATAQGEIELDNGGGEVRGQCNGMHPFTLSPQ